MAEAASEFGRSSCVVCRASFSFRKVPGEAVPSVCGRLGCRARHEWTPEQWAGQARMADARRVAGVPLSDLDREAIERLRPRHNQVLKPKGTT